jgi:hypothetical protein
MTLEHKPNDFRVGDRIEMHPATTLWMRGDRYGSVVAVGSTRVVVHLDKSERDLRLHASAILQTI